MRYFRPLVMSVLKNEQDEDKRIDLFDHIERFIFIVFHLSQARSHYRNSEFYNASRGFDKKELSIEMMKFKLYASMAYCFHENRTLKAEFFNAYLIKRFDNGNKRGFYDWSGLRNFLYEYERQLQSQSRQEKVLWDDLLKSSKDKISIEHILPQTPTESWKQKFDGIKGQGYHLYSGSIGNLLLLSMSINASLQNDDFAAKKQPKINAAGIKVRNGYSDGSHSEIEVARYTDWTPKEIEERGLKLLSFMEERWDFNFIDDQKKDLLFLPTEASEDKD